MVIAGSPGLPSARATTLTGTLARLARSAGAKRIEIRAVARAAIAAFPGAPSDAPPGVVGFITVGRPRTPGLAVGEIETLYVLDDWRDRGVGRQLLAAGAAHLAIAGCRSAFLWVLRDNPNRWFYERLAGRPAAQSVTRVAGTDLQQVAYAWDPIERLLAASPTRS